VPPCRLVVSLHDVAPPFTTTIRRQLDILAHLGVHRTVLKVVPDWHGEHPLTPDSALASLLRVASAHDHQIVLHGYQHCPQGPIRGSALQRLRGRLFAGDTCEYLTLDAEAARTATLDGRILLERAGLKDTGWFCAPGWLLSAEAARGVCEAGISNVVSLGGVKNVSTGEFRSIPAFGYMGAGGLQEAGTAVLGWIRSGAGVPGDVLRVYLHPQGSPDSRFARRTLEAIARLVAEGWRPITYADLEDSA
jgi:uncharacterized protein